MNLETRAVTRDITSMYCRGMASNLHLRIRELLGEFVNVFDGSVVWERGGGRAHGAVPYLPITWQLLWFQSRPLVAPT